MDADRRKWQARYAEHSIGPSSPAEVLSHYQHLLPQQGVALDLACGLGANALLLAKHGLTTHAWDIAENALQSLQNEAEKSGLVIHSNCRDVVAMPPAVESFDVIVVSRFLHRPLIPQLITALRPGGLIFYQTFIREQVSEQGPKNPNYRLASNELLQLFSPLTIRLYREEGCCGDTTQGLRNEAMLIAQHYVD